MVLVSWLALLLGGLLAGLAPVGAMAWPRRFERLAIALALLSAGISAVGLVGISILAHRVDEAIIAGFLGVAAALGGFALGGALLAQVSPEPPPAALPSQLPPPVPGAAVLLLAEAEPEDYDPSSVAAELRELSDGGVQLPTETMRPFIFASEKARYHSVGRSPARDTARGVAARLDGLLEADYPGGVVLSWCDAPPRLDEALATVAGRGFRHVVVAVLAVADDAATARARRRVDAMRAPSAGVEVVYAEPLWSSPTVAEHIAGRVHEATAGSPAGTGVALIGHGQPPEIDEEDPVRTEQETYFQQRLRALLVEHGFEETHVRAGWAEWQEPGVTEVVRHLAALGCRRILVVPAAMPFETRVTLLDIPDAVAQARVERTAEVTVMPAWGDDDAVAAALVQKVREAAADLSG